MGRTFAGLTIKEEKMEISIVKECHEIKAVCEKYGYGNVMEWASALWRYDYMKKGYDKMLGACAGAVGGGK